MSDYGWKDEVRYYWSEYKAYVVVLLGLAFVSTILAAEASSNTNGSFKVFFGMNMAFLLVVSVAFWVRELKKNIEEFRAYVDTLRRQYKRDTGKEPPKPPRHLLDD